jgi:hypothetical protein
MVELREPEGPRLLRWTLIAAAILGAVWLATWASKLGDANARVVCRGLYAEAKTAADTAAADLERPFLGRRDAASSISCADLRLRGDL